MRCPRCLISLNPDEDDGITDAVCPQCHGTWISGIALQRLVSKAVSLSGPQDAQPEPPLADLLQRDTQSNPAATLYCADCHTAMTRDRFHPMIPVQIDRCDKCGYVWLDAGERELLMRLYHDMMVDPDPEVVARRNEFQRLSDLENAPPPDSPEFNHDVRIARAATLGLTAVIIRLLVAFLAI